MFLLIAVAEEAEDSVIEAGTSTVVVDAKLDAAAELSDFPLVQTRPQNAREGLADATGSREPIQLRPSDKSPARLVVASRAAGESERGWQS